MLQTALESGAEYKGDRDSVIQSNSQASLGETSPRSQKRGVRRTSWMNNLQKKFGLRNSDDITNEVSATNKTTCAYGKKVEVIPGRESHTADFDEFDDALKKVQRLKNTFKSDTQDVTEEEAQSANTFWAYVGSILGKALPVGFEGHPEGCTEVIHKGPTDYHRFHAKMKATEIINPINPVTIAAESGVSIMDVLSELLYATKVGLVSMQWAPTCERCTTPICTMNWDNDWSNVKKKPVKTHCQGCRYENTIDCMSKIKVFFVVSQKIFYTMAANFQCHASEAVLEATEAKVHLPANSSGSGWRISVGCGGDLQCREPLKAGLYRMHCPIIPTQNYLRVKRSARESDTPCNLNIQHSKLIVRPGDRLQTLTVPHGRVNFQIFPDTTSEWIFWIHQNMEDKEVFDVPTDERYNFLNALVVLENPTFKEQFEEETESIIYNVVSTMELEKSEL